MPKSKGIRRLSVEQQNLIVSDYEEVLKMVYKQYGQSSLTQEEITSATHMGLYRAALSFETGRIPFKFYAALISYREAQSCIRTQKRQKVLSGGRVSLTGNVDVPSYPADQPAESFLTAILGRVQPYCSDREFLILQLRVVQGKVWADVSTAVGESEGVARQRLERLCQRLRKEPDLQKLWQESR